MRLLFLKYCRGDAIIDISYKVFHLDFSVPTAYTLQSSVFLLFRHNPKPRLHHSKYLVQPLAKTVSLFNSCFVSSVRLWNSLAFTCSLYFALFCLRSFILALLTLQRIIKKKTSFKTCRHGISCTYVRVPDRTQIHFCCIFQAHHQV